MACLKCLSWNKESRMRMQHPWHLRISLDFVRSSKTCSWRQTHAQFILEKWGDKFIAQELGKINYCELFETNGVKQSTSPRERNLLNLKLYLKFKVLKSEAACIVSTLGFLGLGSQQHSVQAGVFGVTLGQHLHGV